MTKPLFYSALKGPEPRRLATWLLSVLGFALMIAYWPGISGAGTTPRWAVIAVALVALPFVSARQITFAHLAGLAFVAWAALSLVWVPTLDAPDAMLKLALVSGLFFIGASVNDLRPFYAAAALGVGVSSALAALDVGGLISYAQATRPAGLFVNSIYLAEAAALVAVACWAAVGWRLGWALMVAPALLLTNVPRGAMLAAACAGIVALWGRSRRLAAFAIGGMALALAAVIWLRPETVEVRLRIWYDVVRALTPIGQGIGSYFGMAPFFASAYDQTLTRHDHPYNEWLEIGYELGLPGLLFAATFIVIILRGPMTPERLVIVAFLVEGLFGFPFHMPATAGFFAIVAGHASRDLPVLRSADGDWGALLRGRDARS